jgi:2-keto-4-pentenoate hydratase/2-oxohepta-3-ene-1,7-dioic acid hydratase in catechol pathway
LRTRVNGVTVQDATTSELIFDVGALVAYVTRWFTLRPGDVLLTGSPSGVGTLEPGDEVSVEISGVGTLPNPVIHGR